MILHLVRHPEPIVAPGTCYGRLDLPARAPLDAARALRPRLPANRPLWSSPLARCRTLAEALHPTARFDERLREVDFGAWEGRRWDDIPRSELDAWAANLLDYTPPGGEALRRVQERVLEFIAELAAPEAVLVTHGGVIRLLVAYAHGLAAPQCLALRIGYASLTRLTIPGSSAPSGSRTGLTA